jgi:hypothetical protein
MIRHKFLRLIRDPLCHFLVLGAGIFILYSVVNGPAKMPADRIIIDENQVLRLSAQFQRTWMRPPTRQELQGLADDFLKEEILYREAKALGIDQDDLVIRRRLRQKMEFLNEDLTEPKAPTNAELQSYFDANRDKFRRSDRLSFQQIYLNPLESTGDLKQTAVELLTRLNSNPALSADPNSIGDVTLLPTQLDAATEPEVAHTFGKSFAKVIKNATIGRWSGPYESGYGLHLVRVIEHETGGLPAMAEIRPILEREWYEERRNELKDSFYQALRARYDVEIRLPDDTTGRTLAVR